MPATGGAAEIDTEALLDACVAKVIEALGGEVLGHAQATTTECYVHLRDDPLKAVADRTSRKIAQAMKGSAKPE